MKRTIKLKDSRTVRRYSESFKLKVLEELESGVRTKSELSQHYGIAIGSIYAWMKKFGRLDLYNPQVYIKMPQEKDKIKALKQEIAELKEAMVQAQLRAIKAESDLEATLELLGEDPGSLKKKSSASRSVRRSEDRKKKGSR